MVLVTTAPIANALLDPVHLMVAGSLAGAVRSPAEIANRTGADSGAVVEAIEELCRLSFVQPSGDGFTVPPASWRQLTDELADPDRVGETTGETPA